MSHLLLIVVVVIVVLGLGMIKERSREKKVRAWIAEHEGTFHWPFLPADHKIPAKELTMYFETQGAHQWAAAIEHTVEGRSIWLIEYSATPAGHSTGRWHCLFAEECATEAEAQRLSRERNESSSIPWAAHGHWLAKRDIGLISSALLDELATRLR